MKTDTLTAGDTLDFTTTTPDYPASAGWGMVYKLIPRTAGTVITITSAASGDDHRCQVGSTTTATWAAGAYSWVGYAIKAAERYTLETGTITITADPGVVTALDTRSSARKALDAVDLLLETYGSKAYLQGFEINGRSQRFHTPGDFLAYRSRLQAEVSRETNAQRIAAGLQPKNQVAVRFNAR